MPRRLTAQQIFNRSLTKTVEQGPPKTPPATHYRYKGRCCAVGVLLDPKIRLSPELNDTKVIPYADHLKTRIQKVIERSGINYKLRAPLLQDIQRAHDTPALSLLKGQEFVDRFIENMRHVARKHGLTLPKGFEPK